MDDQSLREHLAKFYRFGYEVVRLGGCNADIGKVLDIVGDGGFVFSVNPEHVRALRARGVDGRDVYSFAQLVKHAMEGGEVPIWELVKARGLAYLELELFDSSIVGHGDEELPDSQKAIMSTLREAGERMTTTRLLEAMNRAGHNFGDSTVKNALSILVTTRRIDNRRDTSPRGYGLPEWPTV